MINAIRYYYNIEPTSLKKIQNGYTFDNYVIKEKNDRLDIELYKYLISKGLPINRIIKNKNDEIYSIINEKKYYLIERVDKESNNIFIHLGDKNIEWKEIWSKKIDYYEQIINNCENKFFKMYFPYYIGLAELAINVLNYAESNNRMAVCYYRYKGVGNLDPDNLIIDCYIRNYSEYINYNFYIKKMDNEKIIEYIKLLNLNINDLLLLFSRLLFPSYYFDCLEYNIDTLTIFDRINDYESLLSMIMKRIQNESNLNINWIKKA